jgi:alpha-tubulin suppressor-like RCC1 family protein
MINSQNLIDKICARIACGGMTDLETCQTTNSLSILSNPVVSVASRSSLPNAAAYEGIMIYVDDENRYYHAINGIWTNNFTGEVVDVYNSEAWAWGFNNYGRLGDNTTTGRSSPVSVIGGFTDWCQVSASNYHTTAVRTNGTLWAWGRSACGQLGDGTTTGRSSPVSVIGGFTDWCQVSAGSSHTAAVRTNGTLWAWGSNTVGQLGDGTVTSRSSPVSVIGGFTNWCQVSAGDRHTAALRTNGTLWAWGCNGNGRLGDGTTTSRSSPVSVVGGFTDWCQVSAGNQHTAAVRTNGTLWAWGSNTVGQLGAIVPGSFTSTGITGAFSSSALLTGGTMIVPSPGTAQKITTSAGSATISAITQNFLSITTNPVTTPTSGSNDDGFYTVNLPWNINYNGTSRNQVFVGTNTYLTFGGGATAFSSLSATNPALDKIHVSAQDNSGQRIFTNTQGVAPNRKFIIRFQGATGTSGTLGSPTMEWEWHFNENDVNSIELHVNINNRTTSSATVSTSPVSVVGGFTDWCQISAGGAHTAAVRQNGTLWAWGSNGSGRLGDGTTTSRSSPVSVVGGFTDWCQISAGGAHTAAVRTNGTLWAWGYNGGGRLGDGTTTSKLSPVSVVGGFTDWCQVSTGYCHTAAVRFNQEGF